MTLEHTGIFYAENITLVNCHTPHWNA
jgi:hypothetical protein